MRNPKGVGGAGFWIGNVIVMAGVSSIMRAMLDEVAPKLKIGIRMFSETVRADARGGTFLDAQLGEIAKANPAIAIGSYPFFDPHHGPNTNVVLRARDAQKLAQNARSRTCWSEKFALSRRKQLNQRLSGSFDPAVGGFSNFSPIGSFP